MVFKRFKGFNPEAIEGLFSANPVVKEKQDDIADLEAALAKAKLYSLSQEPPTGRPLLLQFTADTWAYFRLWVVCQLLFVLTLGFYGPWGRARKARFIARHWELDGEPFSCELKPWALLKGRLVMLSLLVAFAVLGAWNPVLRPLMALITFGAAPWILSRSFAFRWRTMAYRGIAFGAQPKASPLISALWMLGVFIALTMLPIRLWLGSLKTDPSKESLALVFLPLLSLIFIPALYLWPKAMAALTHARFAQASWGGRHWHLAATAKEVFSHTRKALWSRWLFLWTFVFMALIGLVIYFGSRDLQAVVMGVGYALLTTFGITFSRARRLNFVFNRLSVGGLRIVSNIHPNQASMRTAGHALLAILTLGLSIPWSIVDYNRWRAQFIALYLDGEWAQFVSAQSASEQVGSAIMDALGGAVDIEIGI
jgi:uncharacterized membrane protein YjgN (DUF898 family)